MLSVSPFNQIGIRPVIPGIVRRFFFFYSFFRPFFYTVYPVANKNRLLPHKIAPNLFQPFDFEIERRVRERAHKSDIKRNERAKPVNTRIFIAGDGESTENNNEKNFRLYVAWSRTWSSNGNEISRWANAFTRSRDTDFRKNRILPVNWARNRSRCGTTYAQRPGSRWTGEILHGQPS